MSMLLFPSLTRRWYDTATVGLTGLRVGVDIDFVNDPLSLSRDWTPLATFTRGVSIRRGRSRSLDRFDAGQAVLLFDNRDRRFEPGYTAGPYGSAIVPMRPVRVYVQIPLVDFEADDGGGEFAGLSADDYPEGLIYPLFTGFVESWQASWPAIGVDAVCQVDCTDVFKLFRQQQGRGAYTARMLRNEPNAYWRLGAGTVSVLDWTGNGNAGTASGVNTFADSLLVGDTDGSFSFDGVNDYVYFDDKTALNPGDTFALSAWIGLSTLTADQSVIFKGSGGYHLFVDHIAGGTGRLVLEKPGAGGGVIVASGTVISAGNTYHVGAIKQGTVGAWAVVNGTAYQVSHTPSRVVGTTADPVWIGRGSGYFAGTIDEVAVFPHGTAQLLTGVGTTVLEDMRRWHAVGLQQYRSTLMGEQVADTVCDAAWTFADIDKVEGGYLLAAGTLVSASGAVLDHLQSLAQSDGAQAFVRGDGYVVFQGHNDSSGTSWRAANRQFPSAAFGDGGGTEVAYVDVSPLAIDDDVAYNVVSVTAAVEDPSNGFTGYTSVDMASVLAFGARELSLTTEWQAASSGPKLLDRAEEELARFKTPTRRIQQLQFQANGLSAPNRARLFRIDVSDRITFRRRPPGGGTIEFDVFVEGMAHDLDASGNWRVSVDVSEA